MPNNPIHDEQLAELDRLQHDTTPRPWLYGKVWLDHVPNYMAVIALHNAYPALRKRLLDAEARLAEAERERDELMTMAARAQEVMRQMLNGLTTDDAVWAAYGNADSARAWLAARDAQQRREGAAEWLEKHAGDTWLTQSQGDVMMQMAKRLRDRGD